MCFSQSFLGFAMHNPGIFSNSVYSPVTLLPPTGDYSPGFSLSWHVWVLDCLFLPPHSFPGDPLCTLSALISAVTGTLGIRELALGAGQACPGVRLPARRWFTHADPGPADPDCLDLHTICFPQFESGRISNPGGMLALLSWPSWIPDLVLSFDPSVLLVVKQGHIRLLMPSPTFLE